MSLGKGCCCCCWVASVMSNSVRPHRQQLTRLLCPWDSPGKSTRVGCHFLLQLGKGTTVQTSFEESKICVWTMYYLSESSKFTNSVLLFFFNLKVGVIIPVCWGYSDNCLRQFCKDLALRTWNIWCKIISNFLSFSKDFFSTLLGIKF